MILNERKFYNEILNGEHMYLKIDAVVKYLTIGCYKNFINVKKIKDKNIRIVDIDGILKEIYPLLLDRFSNKIILKNMNIIFDVIRKFSRKDLVFKNYDGIRISKNELNKIELINDEIAKRLAFGILVDQKIINLKRDSFSKFYKGKIRNYFKKFTNATRNRVQQYKKINILYKNNMINFSNPKEIGYGEKLELLYIDEFISDEDTEILITDFREIVLYYLKWRGENISNCEKCNKLIEQKSNRTKYCEKCAREMELEKYKKYNKKR